MVSNGNKRPLEILSGPIMRSKTKQLKEAFNGLIQKLNHDQRVPQIEHKVRKELVNEIKENLAFQVDF